MEDPEFQLPEETPAIPSALASGTAGFGSADQQATAKFGGASFRGSPTRGNATMADKSKKAAQSTKSKDGPEEIELEQTPESLEYAAFRNQRLGTPRMRKLMNKKDAGNMLKD